MAFDKYSPHDNWYYKVFTDSKDQVLQEKLWVGAGSKTKLVFPFKIPEHRSIISCDTIHGDANSMNSVTSKC